MTDLPPLREACMSFIASAEKRHEFAVSSRKKVCQKKKKKKTGIKHPYSYLPFAIISDNETRVELVFENLQECLITKLNDWLTQRLNSLSFLGARVGDRPE